MTLRLKALSERLYDIDDRRFPRLFDNRDLVPLLFFFDQPLDVFAVGIVELTKFELRG